MDFVDELAELARTAKLGHLGQGARLADLAAVYGEPWAAGRVFDEHPWPRWFCYGSLQLVFCQCRQLDSMIVPAWHDELELPVPGPGELRKVSSVLTESAVTAALVAADCRWEVVQYPSLDDQRSLEIEPVPDVLVGFTFTDRESWDAPVVDDWILNKVIMWRSNHDCPEPDPSLPDDGYGD